MGDVLNRGTKAKPLWYCRYVDVDGKRKQKPTKQPTKALAEQYLATVEARLARGEIGIPELTPEDRARKATTVKQLLARFTTEYASPKHKDPHRYRIEAANIFKNRVEPFIGDLAAAAVRPADVERMRDALTVQGYQPWSVIHALAKLSKAYNWGRRVGAIDCDNPVRGCERPRTQSSIDYLQRDEVAKLLGYAETRAAWLHPVIATAIYTGMRKGELFGLRWIDVHLDAARVDVMRSYRLPPKSGKPRHLPLHPELARILTAWKARCPASEEGLVFPVNGRMGDRYEMLALDEVMEAAGCHVPAKPWHSLRHTFASHFMMNGGNVLTLQKLLGHSDIKMTLIYAHLGPDFMANEVARISFTPLAA